MRTLITKVVLAVFAAMVAALVVLVFKDPDAFRERFTSLIGTVFGFLSGMMLHKSDDK